MFSYEEYLNIINAIKSSGKQVTFHEALQREKFVIMRHDVEFSVKRAYDLAKFEAENDFHTIYLFQLTNNTYNLLSQNNLNYMQEIHDLGHEVGLHFHHHGCTYLAEVRRQICEDMSILAMKFPFVTNVFSIHRPSKEILRENIKFPDMLNTYQNDFFSFVETMDTEPEIKYLSDAMHRWNYGLYPNLSTIKKYDKLQILTHPYSWTREGYNNRNNFNTLLKERDKELRSSINEECKHFAEVKNEL